MTRMLHSILTTSMGPITMARAVEFAPPTQPPSPARPAAPSSLMTGAAGTPVSIRAAMWNDLAWREKAACHDIDTNIFFPVGMTGSSIEQTNRAKTICRSCAAQAPCLEFALRTNQDHGVWGAHTEEERRALRRARRAAARRALAAERAQAERAAATATRDNSPTTDGPAATVAIAG